MARLYGRTPGGVEVTKRVAEVNAALAELAGQPLESLSFSLAGWGAYALQVRTDRYSLRLRIDATGVQAESLEASA